MRAIAGLSFVLIAACAQEAESVADVCADAPADKLTIVDDWVRAAPVSATTALYMTVCNKTTNAVSIVGIESAAAVTVELHETTRNDEGAAMMAPVEAYDVAAGDRTDLKPGGKHIMLIGLTADAMEGASVPYALTLADGTKVSGSAEARPRGSNPGH